MAPAPKTLGDRVWTARIARGFKITQLDKVAGVGVGTVSRVETGQRKADAPTLDKLAKALRVRVQWLIDGSGVMEDVDLNERLPRRAEAIRLVREDGVDERAIQAVQSRETKHGDEQRSTLWWVDLIRAVQREGATPTVTGVMRRLDAPADTPAAGTTRPASRPRRRHRRSNEPPK